MTIAIPQLKTRAAYLEDARAVRAKRKAPCPVALAHAAISTCQTCGMYMPVGGFTSEELDVYREGWKISPAPNALDVASVKANLPSEAHLKDEEAWREAKAALEALDLDIATAFAVTQDPGEPKRFIRDDGTYFESQTYRVGKAQGQLDELLRRRADVEELVRHKRAKVAEHEAALDRRRLIWRDRHQDEYR